MSVDRLFFLGLTSASVGIAILLLVCLLNDFVPSKIKRVMAFVIMLMIVAGGLVLMFSGLMLAGGNA